MGFGGGTAPTRAYILAGASYPLWRWLLAPGPNDPPIYWIGIGAALFGAGIAAHRRHLDRSALARLTLLLGSLVTLHFFVLASLNDMNPFYAVGSAIVILATGIFARTSRDLLAYGAFVVALAGILYAADPDPRKLAYWLGPVPTLLFAHQRLRQQNALEQRLEDQVVERTQQLSDANQRLRDESRARLRLEEALRVQHKIEAVGRLAGGVAHDFNNLLTTIGVYAELLLEGLPRGSLLREEVGHIQQAQRQAAALTQQLQTLGRRSHVPVRVIELNDFLTGVLSLLDRVLSGHELLFAPGSGRHPIHGNVDQLQQVVLNLILNARDAMPTPGRVTIETTRQAREILTSKLGVTLESDEYVLLAISDTGTGMSEETRARAFDPFFSTKPPDRGSGLGLSTVHAVVSQASGHVRLSSEPGRGSRFELYWPRAYGVAEREHEVPFPVESNGKATILLVEDEETVRAALSRVLTSAGYFVTEACDGGQALTLLDGPQGHFDLVISDVVMPRVSGFDLAERLSELQPDAKLMLISGHLNDHALSDIDGRFTFLSKPFTPQDLRAKVSEVLGYSPAPG